MVPHLKVMVTGSKGRSPSSWETCRFSVATGALNASTPTLIVPRETNKGGGGDLETRRTHATSKYFAMVQTPFRASRNPGAWHGLLRVQRFYRSSGALLASSQKPQEPRRQGETASEGRAHTIAKQQQAIQPAPSCRLRCQPHKGGKTSTRAKTNTEHLSHDCLRCLRLACRRRWTQWERCRKRPSGGSDKPAPSPWDYVVERRAGTQDAANSVGLCTTRDRLGSIAWVI